MTVSSCTEKFNVIPFVYDLGGKKCFLNGLFSYVEVLPLEHRDMDHL